MKTHFILVSVISITFMLNCSSNSESDLIEDNNTPELVTYNGDIKTIIDNNCIVCHSNPPQNGAPMPLTTYANVKEAVLNRDLIDRISSTDPAYLMPLGGQRLPQNLIDTVIQWEEDGLLEE
ncbi:hypothetical protein [Mangrovimonas aestuarii]|uniref:hypothetical protein n=1 Tax=Mangrovimonas aestuarii TaxID=3018443 RepID=UPI0023780927|nr:hypothetical protein [Mangrovimonas aestuarii]